MFSILFVVPQAAAQFRPSKEWRTVNTDIYEISVQKNGRTDLKSVSGIALFENAFPAVRLAGEDTIDPLPVRAVHSARQEVHDKLGAGQGLALRYEICEWQLRAYPTKPYLAVQAIYHNTRKKPVRIAELLPWCVGEPNSGGVWLGTDAAATRILQPGNEAAILTQSARGRSHLAAYNPVSGRNLIAGFLSSERAWTEVAMSRAADAAGEAFGQFRAICRYDPPVEVPPGGSLASAVFYIAVGEQDPLFGLRRYGKAVAVWNGVRDARPFMPHGMHVAATDAAAVRKAITAMKFSVASLGFRHLTLDAAWQAAPGEADTARFPEGMAALAADAHAAGLTLGLEISLFRVHAGDAIALAHPDWLAPLDDAGRALAGEDAYALDITVPGARVYVVNLARTIGTDWGLDALVDDGSAALLLHAASLHTPTLTKVEAYRMALGALREGVGTEKILEAGGPPAISGTVADVLRVGDGGASSFYWSPSLFLPQPATPEAADPAARLRDYTRTALLGGVVQLHPEDLSQPELLRHLLPVADRPAVPLDFFGADAPAVYHLPFETDAGYWHTLGLFNPADTGGGESVIGIDARQLGLSPDQYFTVFNLSARHYHGLAKGRLEIRVGAGEFGVYGLRPYQNRPMLLALDSNLGMGAMEHTRIDWNPAADQLSGALDIIGGRPYTLSVLVPRPWTLSAASVNGAAVEWQTVDDTVHMVWTAPAAGGTVEWRLQFAAPRSTEE